MVNKQQNTNWQIYLTVVTLEMKPTWYPTDTDFFFLENFVYFNEF